MFKDQLEGGVVVEKGVVVASRQLDGGRANAKVEEEVRIADVVHVAAHTAGTALFPLSSSSTWLLLLLTTAGTPLGCAPHKEPVQGQGQRKDEEMFLNLYNF